MNTVNKRKNNDSSGRSVIAALGGLAASKASKEVHHGIMSRGLKKLHFEGDTPLSKKEIEDIRKAVGADPKLPVLTNNTELLNHLMDSWYKQFRKIGYDEKKAEALAEKNAKEMFKRSHGGPHYHRLFGYIYQGGEGGNSPTALAHEFTHSTSPTIMNISHIASSVLKTPATIYAGYKAINDDNGLSKKEAAGLAAVMAPMLAEETRANHGAYKAMKKLHGKLTSEMKNMLLLSEGSYVLGATAPFIAYGLARGGKKAYDKFFKNDKKGREKS
jgi:hypothetical protein